MYMKANLHPCKLNFVDRFTKVGKIGSSVECFTADFWQDSGTAVEIRLFGGRLGIHCQFHVFRGFS